jgi:hypothetical protein
LAALISRDLGDEPTARRFLDTAEEIFNDVGLHPHLLSWDEIQQLLGYPSYLRLLTDKELTQLSEVAPSNGMQLPPAKQQWHLTDWVLTKMFLLRISAQQSGEDPDVTSDLRHLSDMQPEQIDRHLLQQMEHYLFHHRHDISAKQQAWYWYFAGRYHAYWGNASHAFEPFLLSERILRDKAEHELLLRVHINYMLAQTALEIPAYQIGLQACEDALDGLQRLRKEHSTAFDEKEWDTATAELHTLHRAISEHM